MNAPEQIPQRMTVLADADNVVIRGSAAACEALRRQGIRPVWVGAGLAGWTVDRYKAGRDQWPDVVAILENAGHRITVADLVRPEPRRSTLW